MAAPAAVAADRASYAAKNKIAVSGRGDLLGAMGSMGKGASYVNELPPSSLPAPVAAMKPAERESFVRQKQEERDAVTAEIGRMAKERDSYLKHASPAKKDGFDDRVRKSLMDQSSGVLTY